MEKLSRAQTLLNLYEFGGLNHSQVVMKVAEMIATNARTHRDLRIPAMVIGKYCKRNSCDVRNLEVMLNQIGWQLVQRYGFSYEEAQSVLDDLVEKMVALGRLKHGRM